MLFGIQISDLKFLDFTKNHDIRVSIQNRNFSIAISLFLPPLYLHLFQYPKS